MTRKYGVKIPALTGYLHAVLIAPGSSQLFTLPCVVIVVVVVIVFVVGCKALTLIDIFKGVGARGGGQRGGVVWGENVRNL